MAGVFDHPWLSGLFADAEMAAIWSASTQLSHMLAFEAAWSRAGAAAGLWSKAAGAAAAAAIETADIPPGELAEGTSRDGMCAPELVRRLKAIAGEEAVHRGATSQDVVDTATALSITASLDLLSARLDKLDAALDRLDRDFGDAPLLGRTRMQAALEIKVRDRLKSWRGPIADHKARLRDLRPRVARVQIGGAAGDRAALGPSAEAMVAAIARDLRLAPTEKAWHAMRDGVAEFASALSLITGSMGKIGQDVCLMAQQGIDEIALSGGGGSSAMAHKQNPIRAELLVTLARFNAVQVSAMHHALVHEQERSGAAWALEWMVLPQMAEAAGRALIAATDVAGSVLFLGRAGDTPDAG